MHRLITAADELWSVVAKEGYDDRSELVAFSDTENPDTKGAISFVELDGHPSETLIGFTAPAEWWAVGLLTTGWAAPGPDVRDNAYSTSGPRPSEHPDAVRVRVLALVDRDGTTVSKAVFEDGRSIDEEGGGGFLLDLLRRSVGVPTPPPTTPTSELITALWLMSIEGAAADERCDRARRLSWNQVARLHPALEMLKAVGERVQPSQLLVAARVLNRAMTWDVVRDRCREHGWLAPLVEPDEAGWMDEGILSRYLLSAIPPIAQLTRSARHVLRADVATQLDAALAELADGESAA